MNMDNIRNYMSSWNKYTFCQGVKFCKVSEQEKEQCLWFIEEQNLSDKLMNGESVQGLPKIYEGPLREISFSRIFSEALANNYLTPASYIMGLVKACKQADISDNNLITGIVGRGFRPFASFLREMDLEQKLTGILPDANCFRGMPDDDISQHTDVYVEYKDELYRIWSYQNTSRGLSNMLSKFKGQRGEIPTGKHILCPFDFKDKFYSEDVLGWRLHSNNYIEKIREIITTWKAKNYNNLINMPESKIYEQIKKFNLILKA